MKKLLLAVPISLTLAGTYFTLDKLVRYNAYKRRCVFQTPDQWNNLLSSSSNKTLKLHPQYTPAKKTQKHVVVIGAGIIGVMQAYYLK